MTDLKKITPEKILWVDLEMTGLEPTRDRIVEAAAIVTDWDFTELGSMESGVYQDTEELRQLFDANPWTANYPENTKALIELSAKSPKETEVEAQIIALVNQHFAANDPVLLAGNSIHCDRGFIRQWWPNLEKRLHYRMLDVSAWKVVMQGKYHTEFPKSEAHRALGDIRESIAELQFYLQNFNLKK
jgi:oligoribonuclease